MPFSLVRLFWSLIATFSVGIIGALATNPAIDSWYATLVRPELAPPNWVFAPVWNTLYLLMAVALYLVWNRPKSPEQADAMGAYWIQLVLNLLWSFIFFRWHAIGWALVEIIVLWAAILWTIIKFRKINVFAGHLLWPYLAWVTFATYLNFMLWRLN